MGYDYFPTVTVRRHGKVLSSIIDLEEGGEGEGEGGGGKGGRRGGGEGGGGEEGMEEGRGVSMAAPSCTTTRPPTSHLSLR